MPISAIGFWGWSGAGGIVGATGVIRVGGGGGVFRGADTGAAGRGGGGGVAGRGAAGATAGIGASASIKSIPVTLRKLPLGSLTKKPSCHSSFDCVCGMEFPTASLSDAFGRCKIYFLSAPIRYPAGRRSVFQSSDTVRPDA